MKMYVQVLSSILFRDTPQSKNLAYKIPEYHDIFAECPRMALIKKVPVKLRTSDAQPHHRQKKTPSNDRRAAY